MLDDAYIRRLRRNAGRASKRGRWYRVIALGLFLVALLNTEIVKRRVWLPLTPDASQYLLKTSPLEFSRAALARRLEPGHVTPRAINLLTAIYWSPSVFLPLSLVFAGVSFRRKWKGS